MDKRIGAQFYTIRDHIQTIEDFDRSCKKIADIGYKTVQISATPLEAKPMREILDKYNLQVVTTHCGYIKFTTDIDGIIEYNKTLGCDVCGMGMMPIEFSESNQKLDEFLKAMENVCQEVKKENLYFGYHNHSLEFRKNDGKLIFDRLIEETDEETFNFIVDTYWLQVGGKDPAEVISSLGKRAMTVHFKDYCISKEEWSRSDMTEVGQGNLNWDKIIDACEKSGTRFAIVEQDVNWANNDPFYALGKSYNFLKEKGFE